jgi:hypothetical protein
MSYKPIPFTYGVKTLSQINALTGMKEGDTVYNSTWQIIEIYSGTNWVNNQSVEYLTTSAVVIPKSGTIPSGDRSGNAYPNDGGYNISQTSTGDCELGNADQNDFLGCKIRGTSASGTASRIVVAFSGKWPLFMENDANKGEFVVIDSTAGNFRATTSASSDHVGSVVDSDASTGSDTYRNYTCALQTVELQ